MLVLPHGNFQAFLFDLDGTIADTIPLHYRSWIESLAEHGATFPPALFDAMNGLTLPKTVEVLNEKYGLSMPVDVVLKRKEDLYLALLPTITAVPDVLAVIEEHHGTIPFAIVSGSPRSGIEATLSILGLRDRFDAIVGQEDYVHGKPD
ncbi:MAG TPA: HAD family phosphatase, partial [Polyangiaceae bacterium]